MRPQLRNLQEVVVDEDAIRAAERFGERQHRNAVADAEGMIGAITSGIAGGTSIGQVRHLW